MNAQHGQNLLTNEDSITTSDDWDDAFVTHSTAELRAIIAARYTNKQFIAKESVTINYDPEVLAFFSASGQDWQAANRSSPVSGLLYVSLSCRMAKFAV